MTELYISHEKINSIFQLLGEKENNISYSVGFAFRFCPHFLQKFLEYINIHTPFHPEKIDIRLQKHERAKGFTDFEIIQENEFHIIIEAKRGWTFPFQAQLDKYALRPSFKDSTAKDKRILIFNESTPEYAKAHFPHSEVISWAQIRKLAISSKSIGRVAEKHILNELITYLDKISTMQKIDSNWVYIVSLSPQKWDRDIVNIHRKYYHPVGGGKGGWPKEPPNYIAFRYDGRLQSIHHIESYQVFKDPSLHFSQLPKAEWQDHYLYDLGPAIRPNKEIRTGDKKWRSTRKKAMLDLLLTSNTIKEACDESDKRGKS